MPKLEEDFIRKIAPIVKYMAESGEGTDICLQQGCLPVSATNFYQSVPDISDIVNRKLCERKSLLPGIDWNMERQYELVCNLAKLYGAECSFPEHGDASSAEFYWNNQSFGFYCASLLHYFIRRHKPRRIIEVGSGFSSRVIKQAIAKNYIETQCATDYSVIDPFPAQDFSGEGINPTVIPTRVEWTEPSLFQSLEADDILFIDSTHTVKTGNDVNFLVLEVLPRLKKGVVIHFHDIPMPYEYPEVYYTNPSFRVFWAESYLLQAFLAFNSTFQVLASYKGISEILDSSEQHRLAAFPLSTSAMRESGSLWLQRVE